MMHHLLGRLAQFGGEGALGVLFALSIVNLGIISQRVWFFVRQHISVSAFVKQLVPLLRARDLLRAEALSQQSNASACAVALAGLLRAEAGVPAMERALESTVAHERIHLEDKLVLLSELARLAMLVGILGSLCDVLSLGLASGVAPNSAAAASSLFHTAMLAALAPTIGGLLVAIPAWLARSMLHVHVQRVLGECEFVARLISSQLVPAGPALSMSSTPTLPMQRAAA